MFEFLLCALVILFIVVFVGALISGITGISEENEKISRMDPDEKQRYREVNERLLAEHR